MTTHEIYIEDKKVATVTVRSDVELLTYVSDIRKVYGIAEDEDANVTSRILRMR